MESWKLIQETVQKSISASAYSTWIAPLDFDKIDLDVIRLFAPTRFIADWVKRNFFSEILSAVKSFYPNVNDICISVSMKSFQPKVIQAQMSKEDNKIRSLENDVSIPLAQSQNSNISSYNVGAKVASKFSFDNFVQGESNQLAFASIQRVLHDDFVSFNPLFIHSPSGFGKTHLLHAFVNEMAKINPHKNIIYVSADKFMYSFVKALKENDTYRFKEAFRSADILIIDDLHFIVGKDSTAKELFHIIEDYITNGKQVIIASNNSPFMMEGLNDNIKSRISSGLVVDIKKPDFNLRSQIVKIKANALELNLAPGIGDFIASKISSSVREIEGALNRIYAHSILTKELPTLSNIRKILADILAVNSKPLSILDIKKIVAEKWGISVSDIDSDRKQKDIVVPRQIAMYIAKNLTSKSLPEIGKNFGGRDHATVIYAVKKVKDLMLINPKMENIINDLERQCSAL